MRPTGGQYLSSLAGCSGNKACSLGTAAILCPRAAGDGCGGRRPAFMFLVPGQDLTLEQECPRYPRFLLLDPRFCCKTIWQALKRNNRIETTDAATHSFREGCRDESMLRGFPVDRVLQQYPPRSGPSSYRWPRCYPEPVCGKTIVGPSCWTISCASKIGAVFGGGPPE